MKIECKKFRCDHLNIEEIREIELQTFFTHKNVDIILYYLQTLDYSYSLFIEDKFIASGGFIYLFDGVYEIWQIPSNKVKQYTLTYAKFFRVIIDIFIKKHNVRRLQTKCRDDKVHNRWMKYLKFKSEGLLRKYGIDHADYRLFARILED